jgi:15-hydroxyprostaglandin dehydrogenase (NAD)
MITSSAAGLQQVLLSHPSIYPKTYNGSWLVHELTVICSPMATNPQYTAAKHALVGLARPCGIDSPFTQENITVNCICPTFVPTNLCPPHIRDRFPPEHITPMSTVLKAVDVFLDNDSMNGETVELSLDQLYYRKRPEYIDDNVRWLGSEEASKIWAEGYKCPPVDAVV